MLKVNFLIKSGCITKRIVNLNWVANELVKSCAPVIGGTLFLFKQKGHNSGNILWNSLKDFKAIPASSLFQGYMALNPYKPSILFVGQRQTMQIQIRCHRMRHQLSDQGLHCLLTEFFIKI